MTMFTSCSQQLFTAEKSIRVNIGSWGGKLVNSGLLAGEPASCMGTAGISTAVAGGTAARASASSTVLGRASTGSSSCHLGDVSAPRGNNLWLPVKGQQPGSYLLTGGGNQLTVTAYIALGH